jgi:Uma2 family endonuclease
MTVLQPSTAQPRTPRKPAREVYYPSSDGKPMAETDWHVGEMFGLIDMLDDHFREQPDVYVAANNFLYYEEGDPRKVVSPDVYVVFGVARRLRRIFKLWEEGAAPAVVFEISSRKTRREDLVQKRDLYAQLGVDEYFLCDPEMDYLKPPLQGFRLDRKAGEYRPIEPDVDGQLASVRLGLLLRMEGGQVQLADAATGERLRRSSEVRERERAAEQHERAAEQLAGRERAARKTAERQVERESAARQAAEAEIARLRAEIERLRPKHDE